MLRLFQPVPSSLSLATLCNHSPMSAPINPPQLAADYCARVLDPALHIIRARLLQHRPLNVVDYISQYHSQIKSDIEAAASASPGPAPAPRPPLNPPAAAGGAAAGAANSGKFDTFVMPSGKIEDFQKGLSSRIGFPHLQFFKTMEAEHTSIAGCDMQCTTRNNGMATTAQAEWKGTVAATLSTCCTAASSPLLRTCCSARKRARRG